MDGEREGMQSDMSQTPTRETDWRKKDAVGHESLRLEKRIRGEMDMDESDFRVVKLDWSQTMFIRRSSFA